MNQAKLDYLNEKAISEPYRMALKYIGKDDDEKWKNFKPKTRDREENSNLARISRGLGNYLIGETTLLGENESESSDIESIIDLINEIRIKLTDYHYEKDVNIKRATIGHLLFEVVPNRLIIFECSAQENNGYLANGKLTWADFFFTGILDYLNYMLDQDITEGKPHLKKVVNNVLSLPGIKAWMETRPEPPF